MTSPEFHAALASLPVPAAALLSAPVAVLAMPAAASLFTVGTAVSLAASTVLVGRIARAGECLRLSNAAVGLIAALCADAPEVTSAVTAFSHHQADVGVGVVFGSNIFNLAGLLGLGAIFAGSISVHRRAAILEGAVGGFIALIGLLAGLRVMPPAAALGLSAIALVLYAALTAVRARTVRRLPIPPAAAVWLVRAVREESLDASAALPAHASGRQAAPDAAIAAAALAVVVAASIAMEHGATSLGAHYDLPNIVTGGIILAAVTSLPNAVAGIYLSAKGRGTAVMSGAMNSNAFNVMAGLLVPGVALPLAAESPGAVLSAIWYAAMTAGVIVLVVAGRGLKRLSGAAIIAGYLCFVGVIVAR